MNTWKRVLLIPVICGLGACGLSSDEAGFYIFNYTADFQQSMDYWSGDFADYPIGETDSANFELKIGLDNLPSNLGGGMALMISGNNHSDDLFMFIKRKITNLSPYTDYTIVLDIELASNAPTGAFGAGGAPGESVFLKIGAVPNEPRKVIEGDYYRMNIDKGNQGSNGEDMMVIGNIGVGPNTTAYTTIQRSNSMSTVPLVARSNSKGELWLIIGTDSGFEGVTTLYYTRVDAVFSVSN